MFKFCYRHHCIQKRRIVFGKGERSRSVQSHEWDLLGEDREVAETADDLEREGGREIATEEERTVEKLCFSFAEHPVRVAKRCERRKAQKLMDVQCDAFLAQKCIVST